MPVELTGTMKVIKSGKSYKLELTKADYLAIGRKANWMKEAAQPAIAPPKPKTQPNTKPDHKPANPKIDPMNPGKLDVPAPAKAKRPATKSPNRPVAK